MSWALCGSLEHTWWMDGIAIKCKYTKLESNEAVKCKEIGNTSWNGGNKYRGTNVTELMKTT